MTHPSNHDPFCDKWAEESIYECWACKAIAEARADEREKAAQRVEQWLRDPNVAIPTITLAIAAVRGGEQE